MEQNTKNNNKNNSEEHDTNRIIHEVGEDSTKYGEFVCSYFAWVSLPQQKERVEELEKMTKKGKEEKNTEMEKE